MDEPVEKVVKRVPRKKTVVSGMKAQGSMSAGLGVDVTQRADGFASSRSSGFSQEEISQEFSNNQNYEYTVDDGDGGEMLESNYEEPRELSGILEMNWGEALSEDNSQLAEIGDFTQMTNAVRFQSSIGGQGLTAALRGLGADKSNPLYAELTTKMRNAHIDPSELNFGARTNEIDFDPSRTNIKAIMRTLDGMAIGYDMEGNEIDSIKDIMGTMQGDASGAFVQEYKHIWDASTSDVDPFESMLPATGIRSGLSDFSLRTLSNMRNGDSTIFDDLAGNLVSRHDFTEGRTGTQDWMNARNKLSAQLANELPAKINAHAGAFAALGADGVEHDVNELLDAYGNVDLKKFGGEWGLRNTLWGLRKDYNHREVDGSRTDDMGMVLGKPFHSNELDARDQLGRYLDNEDVGLAMTELKGMYGDADLTSPMAADVQTGHVQVNMMSLNQAPFNVAGQVLDTTDVINAYLSDLDGNDLDQIQYVDGTLQVNPVALEDYFEPSLYQVEDQTSLGDLSQFTEQPELVTMSMMHLMPSEHAQVDVGGNMRQEAVPFVSSPVEQPLITAFDVPENYLNMQAPLVTVNESGAIQLNDAAPKQAKRKGGGGGYVNPVDAMRARAASTFGSDAQGSIGDLVADGLISRNVGLQEGGSPLGGVTASAVGQALGKNDSGGIIRRAEQMASGGAGRSGTISVSAQAAEGILNEQLGMQQALDNLNIGTGDRFEFRQASQPDTLSNPDYEGLGAKPDALMRIFDKKTEREFSAIMENKSIEGSNGQPLGAGSFAALQALVGAQVAGAEKAIVSVSDPKTRAGIGSVLKTSVEMFDVAEQTEQYGGAIDAVRALGKQAAGLEVNAEELQSIQMLNQATTIAERDSRRAGDVFNELITSEGEPNIGPDRIRDKRLAKQADNAIESDRIAQKSGQRYSKDWDEAHAANNRIAEKELAAMEDRDTIQMKRDAEMQGVAGYGTGSEASESTIRSAQMMNQQRGDSKGFWKQMSDAVFLGTKKNDEYRREHGIGIGGHIGDAISGVGSAVGGMLGGLGSNASNIIGSLNDENLGSSTMNVLRSFGTIGNILAATAGQVFEGATDTMQDQNQADELGTTYRNMRNVKFQGKYIGMTDNAAERFAGTISAASGDLQTGRADAAAKIVEGTYGAIGFDDLVNYSDDPMKLAQIGYDNMKSMGFNDKQIASNARASGLPEMARFASATPEVRAKMAAEAQELEEQSPFKGKTDSEIQKMISSGQVTAADMVNAPRELVRMAGENAVAAMPEIQKKMEGLLKGANDLLQGIFDGINTLVKYFTGSAVETTLNAANKVMADSNTGTVNVNPNQNLDPKNQALKDAGKPYARQKQASRSQMEAAESIAKDFEKQGFSKKEAQELASIAIAESGGNTSAHNSAGGGQGAQGMFQWRGDRIKAIEKKFGKPLKSMTQAEQVEAYAWELRNSEKGNYKESDDAYTTGRKVQRYGTEDITSYQRKQKAVMDGFATASTIPSPAKSSVSGAGAKPAGDSKVTVEAKPMKITLIDAQGNTKGTGTATFEEMTSVPSSTSL